MTRARATVAITQICASRRKTEVVSTRRASIFCHSCGMKLGPASGSGVASRYSTHNASSLSFMRSILYLRTWILLPAHLGLAGVISLQNPLPCPEQSYFQSVFINPVYLLQLFER